MEQKLPESIQKNKKGNDKRGCVYVKFYNETRPLYLERDTSGVEMGARLLQIRDRMYCTWDI